MALDKKEKHKDIFESIERIEQSGVFGSSDRSAKLLRYLVEEELADRGERLKAYSIAIDIFEKGEDFDPSSNSLVRVEALRLRNALVQYHIIHGQDDKVRIELKPGSYRPIFNRREANVWEISKVRIQSPRLLAKVGILAAVLFIVGMGAAAWSYFRTLQNSSQCAAARPYVSVHFNPPKSVSAASVEQWKSILKRYLAYYPMIDQSRQRAVECPGVPAYKLEISSFAGSPDKMSVHLATQDGEFIWSEIYQKDIFLITNAESAGLADIAFRVGYITGEVATDAVKRNWQQDDAFATYHCMNQAYLLFDSWFSQKFSDVRQCMATAVAKKPNAADVYGIYAALEQRIVDGYVKGDATLAAMNRDNALAAGDAINPLDAEILMVKLRLLRNAYPRDNAVTAQLLDNVERWYTMQPHILVHAAANYATQGNYAQALSYAARVELITKRKMDTYWPRLISFIGMGEWEKTRDTIPKLKGTALVRERILLFAVAGKIGDKENARFAREWLGQNGLGTKQSILDRIEELPYHISFKQSLISGVEAVFK